MKNFRLYATVLCVLAVVACTQKEPTAQTDPFQTPGDLVSGITSLEYIPSYDDGVFTIDVSEENSDAAYAVIDFEIRPQSLALKVADPFYGASLNIKFNYSGIGSGTILIPIKEVGVDGSVLTVRFPLDNIPSEVKHSTADCKLVLVITAGEERFASPVVPVKFISPLYINGTRILPENKLYGFVCNDSTNEGIPGVPVTDGYKYVTTDENGVYQMKPHERCRKVYLSLPSAYQVPLNSMHRPQIYSEDDVTIGEAFRWDFHLSPLTESEEDFTLMMISDPQCSKTSHVSRYVNETIADMKSYLTEQQAKGKWRKCYAFTLGDIISDSSTMWDSMVSSMSNVKVGDGYLPFFQCMGNHDHDGKVGGSGEDGDYAATHYFFEKFGPSDYSINRGDVHIIVMDDILCKTVSANSSVNGCSWSYSGGYTDTQMEWLRQDLELVPNKANKMVVLCQHIQIRNATTNHYPDMLSLLAQFKEAHVMIGHTHYPQNWIHTDYTCRGGLPVYEHIHGAACGAWWACNSQTNGSPNCYNLYEVSGAGMKNWLVKPTNKPDSYQIRVYDGNQIYTGTRNYEYKWYSTSNKGGADSITAKGNTALQGCFVAEAWNDDDTNWEIEFWQNGVRKGNFTRLANGTCANIAASAYYFNQLGKNDSKFCTTTASHYWYFKPASGNPAGETNWEVRAIQTIPASGVRNTYTRTVLTTDYSEF